jgi:MoaA/NifB/PqqE/SkfB family radical SAM enzyme
MRLLPANKLWRVARYLYQNHRTGEGLYPFYASLKVTDLCGFRCPFCNVWREPAKDLDTDGIVKILRNLGQSSVVLMSVEGGEPLLRKDIDIILEEAARQPFYLLFTTSVRNVLDFPLERYSKWIDLFHLSIDEGHDNLELFDTLPRLVKYPWIVCVQTVVRGQDLDALDEKVKRCADSGAKILVMPAVELEGAEHDYPDPVVFRSMVVGLKRRYPNTVLTPRRYLDALNGEYSCSAASIIIDSDGGLFYPCRTLGEKPVNLTTTSLIDFLESEDAAKRRETMKECDRHCGWYQYFAIDFFTTPGEILESLRPYWADLLGLRFNKRPDSDRYDPLEIPSFYDEDSTSRGDFLG